MAKEIKLNLDGIMDQGKQVAVIAGGIIASRKFLDPDKIFANKIASDPSTTEQIWYQHWGAVKFIGGYVLFQKAKDPNLKMAAVGVMIDGFLQEAGKLTTDKDGNRSFPLGNNNNRSFNNQEMDDLLRQAVARQKMLNGRSVTDEYPTGVAGASVNLAQNAATGVAGMGMDFKGGNAFQSMY